MARTGNDPQVRTHLFQRDPVADADPTFKFACSSAQQYAWIKQYYPELFTKITEKVRAGQFVPVGGMWVE